MRMRKLRYWTGIALATVSWLLAFLALSWSLNVAGTLLTGEAQAAPSDTHIAPPSSNTGNNQASAATGVIELTSIKTHFRPAGPEDAQMEIIQLPRKVTAGQRYEISIVVKNTGTSTWQRGQQYVALGIGNDPNYKNTAADKLALKVINQQFPLPTNQDDGNRLMLGPAEKVEPGQTHTFEGTVQAHDLPGHYQITFRMLVERPKPDGWFGETYSTNISILPKAETGRSKKGFSFEPLGHRNRLFAW